MHTSQDGKNAPPGASAPGAAASPRWRHPLIIIAILWLCATWLMRALDPHTDRGDNDEVQYEGESIKWAPCGETSGEPLECSTVYVPMDHWASQTNANHDHHQQGPAKHFRIPLIRLRRPNARRNLLVNPGGPGGSGVSFVRGGASNVSAIVGDDYHIVGFDPRGVNGSRPAADCYASVEDRHRLSYREVPRVGSFDDSHARSRALYASASNFGKACADRMGEHGLFLNTPQTAADMNDILDALGQEDMYYWGFSYGSLLGQTYAAMFPNRSARVIIDGVINQFDWYGSLIYEESQKDTEHVIDGFFDECIKAGKDCALSAMADTKDELRDKVLSFTENLKENPISVYLNSTSYGIVSHAKVWRYLFMATYFSGTWRGRADVLAKLLGGNATDMFLIPDPDEMVRYPTGNDLSIFIESNDGISGPTYWPQGREAFLDIIEPYLNSTMFASCWLDRFYNQQQWPYRRTHPYEPRRGVETKHPMLILSTTYDPVCPLASARSAKDAFVGSEIVEVLGYGHCADSVPSACMAKHVGAYMKDGSMPSGSGGHTKCEPDVKSGGYFEDPVKGKQAIGLGLENKHEQLVRDAQLGLARSLAAIHAPYGS